jgi:ketosteroid isomerase-like protein
MKFKALKKPEQLFQDFCKGYKDRDLSFLLSLCSKNINMWGSGLDEYRVGLKEVEEQLKRDWSQSESGEIEVLSFVPTVGDALWTAAHCRAKVKIEGQVHTFDHFRGTLVIEKEEGIWKISHMHASFPDYRNAEGGSFPVKD